MDADSVLSVSELGVGENISTHSHTSVKAIGSVNYSLTLRISSEKVFQYSRSSLAISLSLSLIFCLDRKSVVG